jgi:hypothetical protein
MLSEALRLAHIGFNPRAESHVPSSFVILHDGGQVGRKATGGNSQPSLTFLFETLGPRSRITSPTG